MASWAISSQRLPNYMESLIAIVLASFFEDFANKLIAFPFLPSFCMNPQII